MLLVDDHIIRKRRKIHKEKSRRRQSNISWILQYDKRQLFLKLLLLFALTPGGVEAGERIYDESNYQGNLPYKHTARCYSCMSKLYEAVWPSLSHIYKKPRNFTDDCDDERISEGRVPIVHCPTICVSLFEQPNIAGVRIKGYIRGCMSDVLISGFNQTIVTWYRWMHRDSCRPYRKKELFKLGGESTDDSTIDVCTCYADHCNGNSASSSFPVSFISFMVLISWILLFSWTQFNFLPPIQLLIFLLFSTSSHPLLLLFLPVSSVFLSLFELFYSRFFSLKFGLTSFYSILWLILIL